MTRKHRLGLGVVATSLVYVMVASSSASAAPGPDPLPSLGLPGEESGIDAAPLLLPAIPWEMYALQEDISRQFAGDPNLGTFEVTPDRTTLIVRWHGEVPAELSETIAAANAAGVFTAELESARYAPGELLHEAERLVEAYGINGTAQLTSVAPQNDGDGLTVYIEPNPTGRTSLDPGSLGLGSTFPVEVAVEEQPQAAAGNRYADAQPHYAGSAIAYPKGDGSVGLCTSAFRVSKSTGATGMLTASHCGPVGQAWQNDHYTVGGVPTYGFGTVNQAVSSRDGAVLTGSVYQDTRMWAGAWNNATYTNLYGYISNATVGTEICYSGSKAGYVCGSIIQEANRVYSLAEIPGTITGVYSTMSAPGALYAAPFGTGDSGGPGIQFTFYNGDYYPIASTIISAATGSQVTCPGRQETWHVCYGTGHIGTVAAQAASQMGWTVLTVPTQT